LTLGPQFSNKIKLTKAIDSMLGNDIYANSITFFISFIASFLGCLSFVDYWAQDLLLHRSFRLLLLCC